MYISPVQNKAVFGKADWLQKRPRITQTFGKNPQMYAKYSMKGHNGTDYGIPIGTPIYAPFDGEIKRKDSKNGYGLHIRIRNPYKGLECVLGHLSRTVVSTGLKVVQGQLIGYSGNTGDSTGPHLHRGIRTLKRTKRPVYEWEVENYNNGYYGYWDSDPYEITHKGTLTRNNLTQ